MIILLVHHFPGVGGGTISGLDVASMLKDLGHEVFFSVPDPGTMIKESCDKKGIVCLNSPKLLLLTYHNASTNGLRCMLKYLTNRTPYKRWKKFLKDVNPDLVILNSSSQAPLIKVVKELNIPCFCCIRETYRGKGSTLINGILRRMISKADAALYLTSFDMKEWNTANKVQKVLPDIVDSQRYNIHNTNEIDSFKKENGIRNDVKYVLFLGGKSYIKGTLELLKAYSFVYSKNNNIGLILLGDSYLNKSLGKLFRIFHSFDYHYISDCRELVHQFIAKKMPVLDVGVMDDTSFWFESADLVAFPANTVHQPRPAYEAGYYHKPVILPDFDNFKDYFHEGENGLFYKKNSVNDLADKISFMCDSSEMLEQLGAGNHKAYLSSHSYCVAKDILENLLNYSRER